MRWILTLLLATLATAALARPADACKRAYTDVFTMFEGSKRVVVGVAGPGGGDDGPTPITVEKTLRGKHDAQLTITPDGMCDRPLDVGEKFIGFFDGDTLDMWDKWDADAPTVQA